MSKEEECMKALTCLYLEVPSVIADDVKLKVVAAINEAKESAIEDTYTLVTWPDVQELMDEEWFEEEAVLEVEGKFGSSAYFVPTKRLL